MDATHRKSCSLHSSSQRTRNVPDMPQRPVRAASDLLRHVRRSSCPRRSSRSRLHLLQVRVVLALHLDVPVVLLLLLLVLVALLLRTSRRGLLPASCASTTCSCCGASACRRRRTWPGGAAPPSPPRTPCRPRPPRRCRRPGPRFMPAAPPRHAVAAPAPRCCLATRAARQHRRRPPRLSGPGRRAGAHVLGDEEADDADQPRQRRQGDGHCGLDVRRDRRRAEPQRVQVADSRWCSSAPAGSSWRR